jgi:hypothetical protein
MKAESVMFIAYVTVTLVASALNGCAAVANLIGHDYPKRQADMLGIPQWFVTVAGILLGAAAAGLVVGFAVPLLGLLASGGLVLYFVGALGAHIRAADYHLGGWALFFVSAVAALVAQVAHYPS